MRAIVLSSVLVLATFGARANELDCRAANNTYVITYSPSQATWHSIQVAAVETSGVEEAAGQINCSGPNEAAYFCQGSITQLSTPTEKLSGPQQLVSMVIPEATLQSGRGPIQVGRTSYYCNPIFR